MSVEKVRPDVGAAMSSATRMRAVYDGFGAMYPQLRALASSLMSRERMSHTLQPTAVVSEAFLRLADRRGADFESESHLLAYAATAMRSILVDHARRRRSKKRGSGAQIGSDAIADLAIAETSDVDLLEIDDALRALEAADARAAKVVEARLAWLLANTTAKLAALHHSMRFEIFECCNSWNQTQSFGCSS